MLTILGKQFANLRSLTSQAPSKIQATAEEQNLHTSDLHYTPIRVKIAPLSSNLIFYTPSQCTQFGTYFMLKLQYACTKQCPTSQNGYFKLLSTMSGFQSTLLGAFCTLMK